jgi:glutaredoxin
MSIIRFILRFVLLFLDKITSPKSIVRSKEEQKKIDQKMHGLKLYQFEACPFCIKVRRYLKANAINIPLIDAKKDPFRSELTEKGGKYQTPCLQITKADGSIGWMYESNDIIQFLEKNLQTNYPQQEKAF